MPFTFRVQDGLLRIELQGTMSRAVLEALAVEAWEIEQTLDPVPDHLTDLTGVTRLDVGFSAVFDLAQHRLERTFANPFRSALVAATPAQLGIARMYQTLNDHPQVTVRIFPDLAGALAWLAEPPTSHG